MHKGLLEELAPVMSPQPKSLAGMLWKETVVREVLQSSDRWTPLGLHEIWLVSSGQFQPFCFSLDGFEPLITTYLKSRGLVS